MSLAWGFLSRGGWAGSRRGTCVPRAAHVGPRGVLSPTPAHGLRRRASAGGPLSGVRSGLPDRLLSSDRTTLF
ncbi:protein of unknown function [Microbacterium sp. Nx66]|nr:protein of unknown function [Microbacterium sp. Nx66]